MEPNLAGSICVISSIKLLHLVPFGQQTWLPRLILFSDWLMLKKSSPLKQLGQMEPNLAEMVPGCVPFKIVSDSLTLHSRWLLFFKVMIISLWNLLQFHSFVRWAIQAQWVEPLVSLCLEILTWFLVYECIGMSYRSSWQFVPVQWYLAELWPLDFEIWPNI